MPSRAAYISEIDLGGLDAPAGQGIELSQVDPLKDYTLLIMDGSASSLFGFVLDVIHLPAGIGFAGVAMVTDQPWPDNTAQTTVLASLNPASGDTSLALQSTRLLVLMEGESTVDRFDRPVTDSAALNRYQATTLTDWLVLGSGNYAEGYALPSFQLASKNAALSIDLLSRTIDKDAGRVIARANYPDEAIDLDAFFVGEPNDAQQFGVQDGFLYTYTPSMNNLPLAQVPEPGSLSLLALACGLCLRRPRHATAR